MQQNKNCCVLIFLESVLHLSEPLSVSDQTLQFFCENDSTVYYVIHCSVLFDITFSTKTTEENIGKQLQFGNVD